MQLPRHTPAMIASALALAACGGGLPLTIDTPPTSQTVGEGQVATFAVGTSGGHGTLRFQWQRDGSDVSGATGADLQVGPLTLYDDGAAFSATVADRDDTLVSAPATLTVTPRAWSASVQTTGVGSELTASGSQSVADAQGHVTVLFQGPSDTPNRTAMHLGRLVAGSSTLTTENISAAGHDASLAAVGGRIAVDASGRTLAVWTALDVGSGASAVYAAFRGWGRDSDVAAMRISPAGIDARDADVVASADGLFDVVWVQKATPQGPYDSVTGTRFDAASGGWEALQAVEPAGGTDQAPRLASDGQGLVWAVWQGTDQTTAQLHANARPVGSPWSAATRQVLADNEYAPQVHMNASGAGILASLDSAGRVFARQLGSGGSWGSAAYVANYHGVVGPSIAIHPSGRIAIVSLAGGSGYGTLYHWGFDPSTGWSAPEVVQTATAGAGIRNPSVRFDAAGNEVVLWGEVAAVEDDGAIVRARRYIAGGMGWRSDTPTVSVDAFVAGQGHLWPTLTAMPDGSAFAFWFKGESFGTVLTPGYSVLR